MTRLRSLIERFGGKAARHVVRKAEEAAKGLIGPGMLFEEFGLSYFGPIDGHNLPLLIETFKFLKQQNKPVVLHAITQKGRGFQPAIEKQKKFHGLGPYDAETGETKSAGQKTYSEIFAESLTKLATANDKVVAITAAMPNGTALDLFRPHHPKRYFDVGIAEEHAVIFAAGMATKGYKPFCAIYSTFLQRAFDPIVHDVCLQNLPVVFCMDRGGLSGDDGPTHHGLFDISYLRSVPNLIHMVPKNEDELQDMMYTAMLHEGPSAIRYPRGTGPGVAVKEKPVALEIGKAEVIRDSGRAEIAIFGLGAMLPEAERLAVMLEKEGFSAAVINPRFAKPVDRECVGKFGRQCGLVVTLEDHVLAGGFGSAVMETLNELEVQVPVVRVGWPDEFIEHGKVESLAAEVWADGGGCAGEDAALSGEDDGPCAGEALAVFVGDPFEGAAKVSSERRGVPQRLKPHSMRAACGTAKAMPLSKADYFNTLKAALVGWIFAG